MEGPRKPWGCQGVLKGPGGSYGALGTVHSELQVTPAESRPELGQGSPGCGSLILEVFLSCLMGNCGAEVGAAAEAPWGGYQRVVCQDAGLASDSCRSTW